MPSSLELANRIYNLERRLQGLYNQLESAVYDPRYKRTVQNLRSLQNR